MFTKKLATVALASTISLTAFADDCGESTSLGLQYVKTIYKHHCIIERYGSEYSRKTIESSRRTGVLCPAGTTRLEIESEGIYEQSYDNAPIAGYRIKTGQHADGYGWTRVLPNVSDDKGIDSMTWTVDGVAQNTSMLYYRNASRRPLNHSINLKVIDSIGQECNANFNISVASPTCGTRGSNQGCN